MHAYIYPCKHIHVEVEVVCSGAAVHVAYEAAVAGVLTQNIQPLKQNVMITKLINVT
jgi:hypothetical protein